MSSAKSSELVERSESHRANQVYVLTTHQLQVERRESHRANQVDGNIYIYIYIYIYIVAVFFLLLYFFLGGGGIFTFYFDRPG